MNPLNLHIKDNGSNDELIKFHVYYADNPTPVKCEFPRHEINHFERKLQQHLEGISLRAVFLANKHNAQFEDEVSNIGRMIGASIVNGLSGAIPGFKAEDIQSLTILNDESLSKVPWESVIFDNDNFFSGYGYIYRAVPDSKAYKVRPHNDPFQRITLITSRLHPFSEQEILPRSIALPLARLSNVLGAFRIGQISPAVPTLIENVFHKDALADIVHLDVHGGLVSYDLYLNGPWQKWRRAFEKHAWGIQRKPFSGEIGAIFFGLLKESFPIFGDELGHLLKRTRVNAVVLNACQAGSAEATNSFAADLCRQGVPHVVCVRHKLTEKGALHFVNGFYKSLSVNGSISLAVQEARKTMFEFSDRGKSDETLHLEDWLSVTHFIAFSDKPAPDLSVHVDQKDKIDSIELPPTFEWGLNWLQEEAIQSLLRSEHFRKKEDYYPVLYLTGGIDIGLEQLATEFAAWGAQAELFISNSVVIDCLMGIPDIRQQLSSKFNVPYKISVFNLDEAVEDGCISEEEFYSFLDLLKELSLILLKNGGYIVIASTVTAEKRDYNDPLKSFLHGSVGRITGEEMHSWAISTIFGQSNRFTEKWWLTSLIIWVLGGHFPQLMKLADKLSEISDLKDTLDYFTNGALNNENRNNYLKETENRLSKRLFSEISEDDWWIFLTIPAVTGAGVYQTDLGFVDRSFSTPAPKEPNSSFEKNLITLLKLRDIGIVTTVNTTSISNTWSENFWKAYGIHPTLKVLALRELKHSAIHPAYLQFCRSWVKSKATELIALAEYNNIHEQDRHLFVDSLLPSLTAEIWREKNSSAETDDEFIDILEHLTKKGLWKYGHNAAMWIRGSSYDRKPRKVSAEAQDLDYGNQILSEALTHRDQRSTEKAIELFEKAIRYFEAKGQNDDLAHALYGLSTCHLDKYNYRLAQELLKNAEILIRQYGPASLLGEVLYEKAVCYEGYGDYNTAVHNYIDVIKYARATNNPHLACRCFQNLANLEMSLDIKLPTFENDLQSKRLQAEDYIEKAEKVILNTKYEEMERGMNLKMRAQLDLFKGDLPSAKLNAEKAILEMKKVNDARYPSAETILFIASAGE